MARKQSKAAFRVLDEWLTSKLDMPPDLSEALPRMFWLGREQIHIDNHRGVAQFQPDCIRLFTRQGILVVQGKEMEMSRLSATQVEIMGDIRSVQFEQA